MIEEKFFFSLVYGQMMEEREKRDWRKTKKHHRIKEGKMWKWMGMKKEDVQRER